MVYGALPDIARSALTFFIRHVDGSHGHDNDWVSRVIEESASADKTQALVETQIDD